jgi:LmbE family N-acetylglucosaminyl deacetylase
VVLAMTDPGPEVVILSPHLDDGVFSLGAAAATWSRSGARVRVLTVLAGEPGSQVPAGPWDAASGSATAGEATRRRRAEDLAACAELGVDPVWLDHGDVQYGRGDDDAIWREVLDAVGPTATVLAPGFPLSHPDHRWLARLAVERRPAAWRLGFYVEQPYAVGRRRPRARVPLPRDLRWTVERAELRNRRAKQRAIETYTSQLPQLAAGRNGSWNDLRDAMRRMERRRGGEGVAWLD